MLPTDGDPAHQDFAVAPQDSVAASTGLDTVVPLHIQRSGVYPDRLQWVRTDSGGLELAWTLNVQTIGQLGWFDASVSATTGHLVHNSSWVESATYNVLRYDVESPLVGSRTLQVDPQEATASPFGWHDTNGSVGAEFTDTRGNNEIGRASCRERV